MVANTHKHPGTQIFLRVYPLAPSNELTGGSSITSETFPNRLTFQRGIFFAIPLPRAVDSFKNQGCGAGAGRSRNFWLEPEPVY
jgi:hypothetical protein